jgi:transposase
MDTEHSVITEPVRRIEVFTGAGRRRTWSAEDRARIVAETLQEGETVCVVARRHGLSPQQLFGWRRQARQPATSTENAAPRFVPAAAETTPAARVRKRTQRGISGMTVRIGRGADAKTVAAVRPASQPEFCNTFDTQAEQTRLAHCSAN